jgi:arginine decarboxylase-like protein
MIIIIEEEDISKFQKYAGHKMHTSFMYAASVVARFKNGSIEIIKSRYSEQSTEEIVENLMAAFKAENRRTSIQEVLDSEYE